MGLVYLHTNKITNQKYVGITLNSAAEKRWREGKGYETQYFGKAGVAVYGWDGFEHEVLADELSPATAATLECLLIKELETTNPKYGYNTSEGKIFSDSYEEAQKILREVIENNPFLLRRTQIEAGALPTERNFTLDPVSIKTVKASTTISSSSLGSVWNYFDSCIMSCCLTNDKSNTSFLICGKDYFSFVEKGEIILYPFESSSLSYNIDKYDPREGVFRYKTIEVSDDNKIKPTIIITGTIANMKEFPYELIQHYQEYLKEQTRLREAEKKRLQDLENERLARIAKEKNDLEVAAKMEADRKRREERKQKIQEWFRKLFDFGRKV